MAEAEPGLACCRFRPRAHWVHAAPASTWSAPLAGVQRQLLAAHFMLLVRLLRRSAKSDYSDFEPRELLERRIVLSLYRMEQARVSALASHLGNDIAQISRALTAMRRRGLARREKQRDPYTLTEEGRRLGRLIDEVAVRRDLSLINGLNPHEMFELAGLLIHLLGKANFVLSEELAKVRGRNEVEKQDHPAAFEIHSRIQPLIVNIATTMARAASASYKNLAGVSNYEWRILANIVHRTALSFTDLVGHLDSDKAQVSRALDSMVSAGLVDRTKGKRNDPARLDLSEEGQRLYALMQQDALRRNAVLEEGLKGAQRERLQSYLQLLISNAQSMAGQED